MFVFAHAVCSPLPLWQCIRVLAAACVDFKLHLCVHAGTYDALHTQRILAELTRTDEVSTAAFTEVPTATLASLLSHPEVGVDHVDVLSVDTENSELAVLQGMDFGAVTVDIIVVRGPLGVPGGGGLRVFGIFGFNLKQSPREVVHATSWP